MTAYLTYNLSITPVGAFSEAISLSCSGAPPGATCNVSPNSVTPAAGSAATAVVTVSTGARSFGAPVFGSRSWRVPPTLFCSLAIVCFVFLFAMTVQRPGFRSVFVATGVLVCFAMAGCGGGSSSGGGSPGTPAGTYTLTVAAQSSAGTHNTTLTLTVN